MPISLPRRHFCLGRQRKKALFFPWKLPGKFSLLEPHFQISQKSYTLNTMARYLMSLNLNQGSRLRLLRGKPFLGHPMRGRKAEAGRKVCFSELAANMARKQTTKEQSSLHSTCAHASKGKLINQELGSVCCFSCTRDIKICSICFSKLIHTHKYTHNNTYTAYTLLFIISLFGKYISKMFYQFRYH